MRVRTTSGTFWTVWDDLATCGWQFSNCLRLAHPLCLQVIKLLESLLCVPQPSANSLDVGCDGYFFRPYASFFNHRPANPAPHLLRNIFKITLPPCVLFSDSAFGQRQSKEVARKLILAHEVEQGALQVRYSLHLLQGHVFHVVHAAIPGILKTRIKLDTGSGGGFVQRDLSVRNLLADNNPINRLRREPDILENLGKSYEIRLRCCHVWLLGVAIHSGEAAGEAGELEVVYVFTVYIPLVLNEVLGNVDIESCAGRNSPGCGIGNLGGPR